MDSHDHDRDTILREMHAQDTLFSLWTRGIPQLDAWRPRNPPNPPLVPSHPRPARPLPSRPTEGQALRAMSLTDDEADLYDEVSSEEVLEETMVGEGFYMSSPDCLMGHRLALEIVCDWVQEGDAPDWWRWELSVGLSLLRKLHGAEEAHDAADREWGKEVGRTHAAPDTDPAWRAYDEAIAAYPAKLAAWREQSHREAQERTGFASEKEAAADYWSRHPYTMMHALMGYTAPETHNG